MCGIAGIINKNRNTPQDHLSLKSMMDSMIHRGPDGEGSFQNEQVLLAMRRLSIIDLKSGWQPLWNEDKSIVLIANGEIYNYKELQKVLQSRGHKFRTKSDCENIIHLYEDHGENLVKFLRGMFAFCLYDLNKNIILIFRDRMGEKPLYYSLDSNRVIFSSEMKSLLSSKLIPFRLNNSSIYNYFFYQYIPEPETAIENIYKLPAGHYLKIDLTSWIITKECYWRMEDAPIVDEEPILAVRKELDTISQLVIRSDVPVGVALSGGLDSSSIAALAVKYYPGTIQAYSVGYPGRPDYDERNDAIALGKILKIPIHEIELTTNNLVRDFPEMNFFRDDPIADVSGYGYYSISKAAKQNGTPVVLQGQGGDELFWGYSWIVEALKMTQNGLDHGYFVNLLIQLIDRIPKSRSKRQWYYWLMNLGYIKDSFLKSSQLKKLPVGRVMFYDQAPDFLQSQNSGYHYFSKEFLSKLDKTSPYSYFSNLDTSNLSTLFTRLICESYLFENGIAQGDRLSMSSSIELRLPFVDFKLVELVIGLRKNEKYKKDYNSFPKPWLKGAMRGILPDSIMDRPKKGFAPPVSEWHHALFQNYGNQLVDGILAQEGIFDTEAAIELSKGPSPQGSISAFSFKALVLENWARQMKALTE